MTAKAVVHHYFPVVIHHAHDEQEAVRRLKIEQANDFLLIEWGQSFIADSSGGRRHQIGSVQKFQPRSK